MINLATLVWLWVLLAFLVVRTLQTTVEAIEAPTRRAFLGYSGAAMFFSLSGLAVRAVMP